jgi:hypothetical protein
LRYTIDELRAEAMEQVRQWYRENRLRAAFLDGGRAWAALSAIAESEGDTRVAVYYFEAGMREERRFKADWEAWRESLNG